MGGSVLPLSQFLVELANLDYQVARQDYEHSEVEIVLPTMQQEQTRRQIEKNLQQFSPYTYRTPGRIPDLVKSG